MVIFNSLIIKMEKNLYEELGLKKNATKSEIKSSYRSLVKQHHPDAVSYTHLTLPTIA